MSSEEDQELEELVDTLNDAEEQSKSNQIKERQCEKKEDKNNKIIEEKSSSKMFTYAREIICFFLAVAFTALAAIHSSPPRISKPPIAKPFFNESSVVLDFYKGHLSALVDRVTDSDFSFVMYYAPWDAECQLIKEEFENTAKYYHSKVFFAAINCWQPGSECKSRYSKIQSYPVLMLYPLRESGIQYRGIKNAPYMINFIHNFMNPIKRVTNNEELMELLKTYDAVMIGYFNFMGLSKSPGYREFYKTALRMLEKIPNGEIAFAVITNEKIARKYGVMQLPSASLLMWNETLFYPDENEWTTDNLSTWINNIIHQVTTWLQPPGSKSSTLAPYLWEGPVLFLFTPRNPLHLKNNNYNLLKEIGLQYYDCSGNSQVKDIVLRLRKSRLESTLTTFEKRKSCLNILEYVNAQECPLKEFAISEAVQQRWMNGTANCCSNIPTNKCVACSRRNEDLCAVPAVASHGIDIFGLPFAFKEQNLGIHSEFVSAGNKDEKNIDDNCSTERCDLLPVMMSIDKKIDHQSATFIKEAFNKEKCRRFLAGYSYQHPVFPHDSDNKNETELELTNSICEINKTLALVTIDSLHYFYFAESLGIDIGQANDKTAVVILDPDDESQYILQKKFGRNTLVQFINNYTKGYLRRTMRSNKPKHYVHSFISKSECKEKLKFEIWIPQLTTKNFLETINNSRKDVVVMYYSPYCAFCNAVAFVYLTVANYLFKMDHLEFVRIDGDNNDLPWEYTINQYPSILFFPAKRKEDSTLFPWTLPVTVGNLLNFVLANLDEESQIEAQINVCAAGAGELSPSDCIQGIYLLCLDALQKHFHDFRKLRRIKGDVNAKHLIKNRKRALLLKIEHIRQIQFILATSKDLSKNSTKVQYLRKKFTIFYAKLRNFREIRIIIRQ